MLNFKNTTTVQQGTIGLGIAIGHFASKKHTVLLPLVDNQEYDLAVEIENKIEKIQVKTTSRKEHNNYVVQLRSVRHNKTSTTVKKFNGKSVDWLFVVTEEGSKYSIPAFLVDGKYQISLGDKYSNYKVA